MKKLLSLVLVLVLSLGCISVGHAWEQIGEATVCHLSKGNTLILRSGPGTDYKKLAEMTNGTIVSVFSVSGSWAEIDYHGVHGYAHTKYLDIEYFSTPTYDCSDSGDTYNYSGTWTSTAVLCCRTGPGTDYDGDGKTFTFSGSKGKSVKVISAAYDKRNGIWWVQIERTYNNGELRRAYTGIKKRFANNYHDELPTESVRYNARVTSSHETYYGPGTYYERHDSRVFSGTTGKVISIESGWAQFEYTLDNGYKHRVWLPSGCLQAI